MARSLKLAFTPILALSLALSGCGDDPVDPEGIDITAFVGTWTWIVSGIESSCGFEDGWEAQVVITRVGNSDTNVTASSRWRADDPGPFEFAGTVSGNTLTIPNVTYLEGEGTPSGAGLLVATHEVVLQNNGNLFGEETWTWTSAEASCTNGTADILAIRVN